MADEAENLDQGLIADAALLGAAPPTVLVAMAASALVHHGADMATAQLATPDGGLALVAHPGFTRPFGERFAIVREHDTPCAVAYSESKVVEVPDLSDDPILNDTESQTLLLDAGSRSVTSFPLFDAAGTPIGVISAHYRTAGHHDPAVGRAVAERVQQRMARNGGRDAEDRGPILENAQLREALATREAIAQAQGILMVTHNVDTEAAFQLLVRASQTEHVKLRDVARRIVAEHERQIADPQTALD